MIAKWLPHGLLALVVSVWMGGPVPTAFARQPAFSAAVPLASSAAVPLPSSGSIAAAKLPREAQATLHRVEMGGPFTYRKDGSLFRNFERQLPPRPRAYYREYTVETPRSLDRGARRIVCGGPPRQIDDCYYTNDHYASFQRIVG
ncbi:MAG TPA: ribonuclease domain-containing protein [Burkholderiales bacterium]|jgi:ribonuclease T1|nr:ribonuclease domain-containing protein [Burkholderiales bacterium]